MFTNRPRTYSLGMFLLGFLLLCSVQGALGQDAAATVPTFGNGEKARIQGVITKSDSGSMTIRDQNGCEVTVLITCDTETKPSQTCGQGACPGRCVKVEGRGNCSGQLVAEEIKFRKDDCNVCYFSQVIEGLKQEDARLEAMNQALSARLDTTDATARAARAVAENAQKAADTANLSAKALSDRISGLDTYEAKEEAVVTFATGSAVLTQDDKGVLDQFAAKALNTRGYMIEISGFTDSRGSEAFNNRLSDWRANAVMRYLVSVGNVPVRRILITYPGGETNPVASNDTVDGRAENRRAITKLLISPALAGETLTQTSTDH